MRIIELESRTPEKLDRLLEIWERSVRATHSFLSGGEVEAIKAYVPQAMGDIPHLVVAEDEGGDPAGFLGAGGRRLEMLFLLPEKTSGQIYQRCQTTRKRRRPFRPRQMSLFSSPWAFLQTIR